MAPTALDVRAAVSASGVRYQLAPGWDDPGNAAPGSWSPSYVILHHTASGAPGNAPSLGWVIHDNYFPVRACHFLVARDGLVHVVYALGAYHAGAGGPGAWGDGGPVAADVMNHHAYGIEIESAGTSLTNTGANGYTAAQLVATAKLTAALLDLLGRSTSCAINHRTWAPGRKTDTLLSDAAWHDLIAPYRGGSKGTDTVTPDEITAVAAAAAHAVWNTTYPDIVPPGAPASMASLLLRVRQDADVAATATTGGPTSLTPGDVAAIAAAVADLLGVRLKS